MLTRIVLFSLGCMLVQCIENPIKHLLILMMENRSFDHYLGWLKERNSAINGLTGNEYQCTTPGNKSSTCVYVSKDGYDEGPDDPDHSFGGTAQEIYGYSKPVEKPATPYMNGFVWNAHMHKHNLSNPMAMFTIDNSSAPVLNTLALEYGVFDNWYCSVPSSTDPNRGFAMSGTSNGMVTNYNGTKWSQKSYFQFLREHNVSWATYYDEDVWAIGYFADMNKKPNSEQVYPIQQFYKDLNKSDLPSFIWLQPSLTTHTASGPPNWQHPDASVEWGEVLIQNIYQALRDSQYWNSSALVITYDEHGGFFDHVSPPQKGVPPPDGVVASNGFKFDRLGVRIPSVVVSPWVKKGSIITEPTGPDSTSQWESTSNLATANKLFGVTDAISARQAWAATYENIFTEMDEPRTDYPVFDKPKEFTIKDVMNQWVKPLNEHLKIQVKFYCDEMGIQDCPTFNNQGDASKFIIDMVPRYLDKIQNQ
eukprot:552530_1